MIRKDSFALAVVILGSTAISYCTGSRAADTTVTCTAPTTDTAGAPIGTITGYRLYKGLDSANLAVHGEQPQCNFAVTGLTTGTWYFAAKTLRATDESTLSNPGTFIVPADTPPPDPNPTPSDNLALNKPTTASSNDGDYSKPSYATDGIGAGPTGTRWAANRSDFSTQYLNVDLGAHHDLSKAHISMESSCAKAYSVDASDDNATWTTLGSVSNNSLLENDVPLTGGGRYVRMAITERCSNSFGASVWELQIFGTGGSTPPPDTTPPPSKYHVKPTPTGVRPASEPILSLDGSALILGYKLGAITVGKPCGDAVIYKSGTSEYHAVLESDTILLSPTYRGRKLVALCSK